MGVELLLTWERQRPRGRMGLFRLHPHQEAAMPTMTRVVRDLKANLDNLLPPRRIRGLAADLGLRCRERSLTPVVTSYLFLQQVLHGNPAVGELRHVAGFDFTDSAYCQARQRLPVGFFHRLHQAVLGPCRAHAEHHADALWHDHRLFVLDGSSFSMPDTAELREAFGYPPGQAEGCGFPTAHLLVEFDLHHGYLLRALAAPCRTHDLAQAAVMHQDLRPRGCAPGGSRLLLLRPPGLVLPSWDLRPVPRPSA